MKILLDENVDHRIKKFLEDHGFDVYTTPKEDLNSRSDREIIDYALENSLTILTHDDDFLSITDGKEEHPTLIFLPQRIRFREMKNRLEDIELRESKNQIIYP